MWRRSFWRKHGFCEKSIISSVYSIYFSILLGRFVFFSSFGQSYFHLESMLCAYLAAMSTWLSVVFRHFVMKLRSLMLSKPLKLRILLFFVLLDWVGLLKKSNILSLLSFSSITSVKVPLCFVSLYFSAFSMVFRCVWKINFLSWSRKIAHILEHATPLSHCLEKLCIYSGSKRNCT